MKSDYISIDQLDPFGSNPPITLVHSAPEDTIGALSLPLDSALRLRDELLPEIFLDALLVRKDSDVLIVGFHGALNQEKTNLPRFERLSTVLKYPVSSIFFGDPALWKSRDLQLLGIQGGTG